MTGCTKIRCQEPVGRVSPSRVLRICFGVLGIVAILDAVRPSAWRGTTTLTLRLTALGILAVCLVRMTTAAPSSRNEVGPSLPPARVMILAFLVAGIVVLLVPSELRPTALVLLTAFVEEVVFRRELPAAMIRYVRGGAQSAWTILGAMVLAQVVFAACHFVVQGHQPPLGESLPFVRLFAAGMFLTVIVGTSGLPVAVALHFGVNELNRTGRLGGYAAPSDGVALLSASIAVLAVLALARLQDWAGVGSTGRMIRRNWLPPAISGISVRSSCRKRSVASLQGSPR